MPETMNLPIFYRIGARGPRTASLFFPFFCVRSRYWHLASFSEREREREREMRCGNGLRKMSEQETADGKTFLLFRRRRRQTLNSSAAALPLVTLPAKQKERLPPSLPSILSSLVRLPIQFPISVSPSFSAHAINRPTEKLCFREENGVKIGRAGRAGPSGWRRGKVKGNGMGIGMETNNNAHFAGRGATATAIGL